MKKQLFHYLDNLIDLTREKYDELRKILDITNKQSDFLTAEDMDTLQSLIYEKQECIDKISTLDVEFDKIYSSIKPCLFGKDNKSLLDGDDKTRYSELKVCVKEITSLINEIHEIELKNKAEIGKSFSSLKQQLKSVNEDMKGYSGYKKTAVQAYGAFIDKKK